MRVVLLIAAFVVVLAAGCLQGPEVERTTPCEDSYLTRNGNHPLEPNTVYAGEMCYRPTGLRIPVGTTIRFMNDGHGDHPTVIQNWGERNRDRPSIIAAGAEDPGTWFEYTFNVPGRYQVWCLDHGGMNDDIEDTGEWSATGMAMRDGIEVFDPAINDVTAWKRLAGLLVAAVGVAVLATVVTVWRRSKRRALAPHTRDG